MTNTSSEINSSAEVIVSPAWGWDNVRRDAFQLIAWGYQLAEVAIRQQHLEERITGLIRKGINQKLNDYPGPRFEIYVPLNEDPIDDTGELGKDRPLVDISIVCGRGAPRKTYRFEAKRCAKNSNPISWYTKGIEVYVNRTYARDAPEASVIGLVQTDTSVYWKTQLRKKTKQDQALHCKVHPADVEVVADLPGIVVSTHRREDHSLIDLYHVFLDCRKPSSENAP